MKTITTTVYTFDELSDNAKEKARNWYRNASAGDEWWGLTYEDAERIGLKIEGFDLRRSVDAKFIDSAEETAHKIEKEHGKACDTFIDAKDYLKKRDELIDTAERDENGDFKDEYALDEKLDELDKEFLYDLSEDYRIILQKDLDYIESDEYVDESILANEYTFTVDGKRF